MTFKEYAEQHEVTFTANVYIDGELIGTTYGSTVSVLDQRSHKLEDMAEEQLLKTYEELAEVDNDN